MPLITKEKEKSDDLWRFDTSKGVWEEVYVVVRPSARNSHVMTSVGLDLWLHGSYGTEGEVSHVTIFTLIEYVCCGVGTVHHLCVYGS
jgi:hypothetical protein